MTFLPGCSPHSNYPFALHDTQNLPWGYTVSNGTMVLHSVECTRTVDSGKGEVCGACEKLQDSTLLQKISERIKDGTVSDSIPFAYRSIAQLRATLKHKDDLINFFRLRGLNQAKSLVVRSNSLAEYKRFMVAISKGTYGNVERLIRIGLNQHRSISVILQNYYNASKGMYQPKSYTEEEDMKGLLLFKLGGNRVAGIAHRALGLPAVSTLRTRAIMPALIPSHATPTVDEVAKNIESCFESIADLLDGKNVVHQVGMFDEIAIEKRVRWDELSNFFLGLCREHGGNTSLEFNSLDDLDELFGSLERKEVHYAAEVGFSTYWWTFISRSIFGTGNCLRPRTSQRRDENLCRPSCPHIGRL